MKHQSWVAMVLALFALGSIGCGQDEVVAPPVVEAPDVVIVTLDVDAAGADEVEQAADVVRRRLDALGVEGEVGWDEEAVEVFVPGGDEDLIRAALEPIGDLQFRPVLELLDPTTSGAVADNSTLDPTAEVNVPGRSGELYRLGPAELGGEAVEGTVVAQGASGEWTLNPTFIEGATGIDAFNAAAAACYESAAPCPGSSPDRRGQLALVYDGVVLSAPVVQVPTFSRDQIQISGGFAEVEARALAVSLDAGVSPARWTVRD